jgi:hypothetical protein
MYHHLESTKKQFIGKTLESITRIDVSSVLIGFGDGARCKLSVEGDCCSTSIFYEIEMPDSLKGATLEDIIEREWDEDEWNEVSESKKLADSEEVALAKIKANGIDFYPEENKIWNVVLKTNRGNALVRHINSSNGYYDGYTSYELA